MITILRAEYIGSKVYASCLGVLKKLGTRSFRFRGFRGYKNVGDCGLRFRGLKAKNTLPWTHLNVRNNKETRKNVLKD